MAHHNAVVHPKNAASQSLQMAAQLAAVPAGAALVPEAWAGEVAMASPACDLSLVQVAMSRTVTAVNSSATGAAAMAVRTTMEAGAVGAVLPTAALPAKATALARVPAPAVEQTAVSAVRPSRAAVRVGLRAAAFARCSPGAARR
jgi:hypothetical protein